MAPQARTPIIFDQGFSPAAAIREKPAPFRPGPTGLGIAIGEMSADIAMQLDLPSSTKGLVVAHVEEGGLGDEAGLRPGDVIQEVNRKPVTTVPQFQEHNRGSTPLLLIVNRDGHRLFVAVPVH
jgi:serine protease Do